MNESIMDNELLSSISHDMRTELNTIVGLSEDIYEYENVPEEIRDDAEGLVSSSKNLLELVNNVLDFLTIRNNEAKIISAPYNPKELFEKIANKDEAYIEDNPVSLHTNIDSNIPFELIGDKKYIGTIVNNLLINSIKYTDGGDIWFDVNCINDQDNCNLTITVKDTGRGMKEEEIENLFDQNGGLNIERDKKARGTCLGLIVTKLLLDMMGGTINVDSTFGEGTTITVNLNQKINLMEESELSRTQRLRLQEINYAKEGYGYKKILIVDDNELNIKVAFRILEQYDLILDECTSGQDAIDIVSSENDYDLILMDIMMPGMNGEETLKRLKEIDGFNTPVIALTAETETGSEDKFESEGFAGYIAKPFSKTQIIEELDKVLKEKEIGE